ncbi:hypothetical protein C6A37_01355 [Desulfobacteraceae bacterium SEEP-SAG9]|nr:hypothetical protein C6A37_01355 [Desulfobacteraceae bacterium SEEP-SAG9]
MISFLKDNATNPPKIDEIELTFFGPGFGESIVVFIPGIGWGIIDSCEFEVSGHKLVPPLEYLISQKVNEIEFLVLTHPHADHFKGMEQIIRQYLGKINRICRYQGDSIRELTAHLFRKGIKGSSGATSAKALAAVFEAFEEAAKFGAEKRRLGALTQVIPHQKVSVNGQEFAVEVLSLSPLAEDEEKYTNILMDAFPQEKMELKEISDHKHNMIASAIRISVGNVVVILGSDVEKGVNASSGWRGIVNSADAPDLCVKTLKVPHHGSPGAYYHKAWAEHCKNGKIISVITPFNKGSHPRPTENDIERVGNYSKLVGLTSHIRFKRPVDVYNRALARRLPKKWKVVQTSKESGFLSVRYDLAGNKTFHTARQPAEWIKKFG